MTDLPTCSTCLFWWREMRAGDDARPCRRYPPMFASTTYAGVPLLDSRWPRTNAKHWCGEWAKGAELEKGPVNREILDDVLAALAPFANAGRVLRLYGDRLDPHFGQWVQHGESAIKVVAEDFFDADRAFSRLAALIAELEKGP